MEQLYYLRLELRKIQDYIFLVPKLKYMLGANTAIGEMFAFQLKEFRKKYDYTGLFKKYEFPQSEEFVYDNLKENFAIDIISSAGGHFETIFAEEKHMHDFVKEVKRYIKDELSGLEYTFSYKIFQEDTTLWELQKTESIQICDFDGMKGFVDSPLFRLCNQDGISYATNNGLGIRVQILEKKAAEFYNLSSHDWLVEFYKVLKLNKTLPHTIEQLAQSGNSLKNNMVAYIKMDGNGMGAKFQIFRDNLAPHLTALDGFVEIEKFWFANREKMRKAMQSSLKNINYSEYSTVPFILFMLGGDDLFLVCLPELALDYACQICRILESYKYYISGGIAFVKESYPIGLANDLAESCLASAKMGSYSTDNSSYIDWHVHFDTIQREIGSTRKSDYSFQYLSNGKPVLEILSARPYPFQAVPVLIQTVSSMASKLDSETENIGNNKIKGYRIMLKQGKEATDYHTEMLLKEKDDITRFLGGYENIPSPNSTDQIQIWQNTALDKIELLEFYRTQVPVKKTGKTNHKNKHGVNHV
jgi:hypothetical protein